MRLRRFRPSLPVVLRVALITAATVPLWYRSGSWRDRLSYEWARTPTALPRTALFVSTNPGAVEIGLSRVIGHDPTVGGAPTPLGVRFKSEPLPAGWSNGPHPAVPRFNTLIKHVGLAGEERNSLSLPMWLLPPLLALLPTAALTAYRRHRDEHHRGAALAAGLCPTCGYDCRATPEPAREGEALLQTCPECGTELAAAAAPAAPRA